MSLHPSLKIDAAGTQQRSVLSRIERIKALIKKGQWKDNQSVLGLPKTKIVKIKARKAAKEATAEGAEAVPGAVPAAGAAPAAAGAKSAPGAKPAAGVKPATGAAKPAAPAKK